jgi:hypothetical protein
VAASAPLTYEVLVDVAEVVAALQARHAGDVVEPIDC